MLTSNNVIRITGGSSGIELRLVRQFYELENKIIVATNNQDNLAQLKIQFPKIKTRVCNLGSHFSVRNLIDKCLVEHS